MGVSVSPAIAKPVDGELHNCGNRTRIEGTSAGVAAIKITLCLI
jgi:hypothetical protein